MTDESKPNPWATDADALVGPDAVIGIAALTRHRRLVADALARAYEHGFAQGRLAEIDRAAIDASKRDGR